MAFLPAVPTCLCIGADHDLKSLRRYDKADDDAESDADEDEEVEEFEFSDDDSEAVWHRKRRAAEPPKRKMPPSGPSSAMHTGALAAHSVVSLQLKWSPVNCVAALVMLVLGRAGFGLIFRLLNIEFASGALSSLKGRD